MKVYGISTKSLKDFCTTERELLRKISRIPPDYFRMWEIDIEPESRIMSMEIPLDIDEKDKDLFNGYVFLNRLDVKKYNTVLKLKEE